MTSNTARIGAIDRRIAEASAQLFGVLVPAQPVRPYIPETVVILLDGQRFVIACQSWGDCLTYAESVYAQGLRLATADECTIYPPSQVKRITARKRAR